MGTITFTGQSAVFLCSFILGAVLAVIYAAFSVIRNIRRDKVYIFVLDMIFCFLSALIVYCFLILTTLGKVRAFVIFGCLAGFLFLRLTFYKILYSFFELLKRILIKVYTILSKWSNKLCFILEKFFLKIKKLLKHIVQMMYNQINNIFKRHRKSKRSE